MADDGPLQLSLCEEQDLAEIASPDSPGERLVACRNPHLAAERARKREDLLAATEKLLAPVIARVRSGRLAGAANIGVEVGKVISKQKTAKHFAVAITDDTLAVARRQDQIDAQAALDGIYVIRTPLPAATPAGPPTASAACSRTCPPCPATRSSSPAPAPPARSSPSRPASSGKPSSSSAPRSRPP